MKKLSLVALLAAVTIGAAANAVVVKTAPTVQIGDEYFTHETEQNIEHYLGEKSLVVATAPCAAPCPCPMECPCVPGCCPAVRGLFDGGQCCGGRAV